MDNHGLTVQEFPSCLGTTQRFLGQGSFFLYDEPCAIRLKGNLEAIMHELFPFGTLTAEMIAALSCKEQPPAPCDPMYLKSDELLVTEEALMLWKRFRGLFGKIKLIYLPSQLSELVRYNSDFDFAHDEYIDYGDQGIASAVDAALLERDPFFETALFCDGIESAENRPHYKQSVITQRRRFEPLKEYSNGSSDIAHRDLRTSPAMAW